MNKDCPLCSGKLISDSPKSKERHYYCDTHIYDHYREYYDGYALITTWITLINDGEQIKFTIGGNDGKSYISSSSRVEFVIDKVLVIPQSNVTEYLISIYNRYKNLLPFK